jgi:hypothetical protein
MTQPQPSQPEFSFQVPDELASGVYSNVVAIWHTPYEFTLDFASTQPVQVVEDDDGNRRPVIPARVVARVKIPPAAVFELMQALSTNERVYEERLGPIRRPGHPGQDPPLFPPDAWAVTLELVRRLPRRQEIAMVQPTSGTGTTIDVPVVPDGRVRYEQLPPARPLEEYRVAAIAPTPRDDR